MDAVTTKGSRLIYFDQCNLSVSGCQINNLNFDIARRVPTFEDHWLLPKKALGPKLRIEADIVKENLLSIQLNRLYRRFWRFYMLLGFILTAAIYRLLIENLRAAVIVKVNAVDYILSAIQNQADSIVACIYYYKALKDIIRILKGGRQSDKNNDNSSDNDSRPHGSNRPDNGNHLGNGNDSDDGDSNNNKTGSSNDGVLQQRPTQGTSCVPTRAESVANAGPITTHPPQAGQEQNKPTEAGDGTRFTRPASTPSPSSSPSRRGYGDPATINLVATFNAQTRLITDTPSRSVSTIAPTLNTAAGPPTASTSASNPAPDIASETTFVDQPTTTSSSDAALANQSATTYSVDNASTSFDKMSGSQCSEPLSEVPQEATSAPQVSTAALTVPTVSDSPVASSTHAGRGSSGEEIAKGSKPPRSPKGKGREVQVSKTQTTNPKSSKASSSKPTTAIPGRITKPFPPRSRRPQEAKVVFTGTSSTQQGVILPQHSAAPVARLATAVFFSCPLEDRESTPDFVVRKKRTKSAPVSLASSTPTAPNVQEFVEASTLCALSQHAVDASRGVPSLGHPTLSLNIDTPVVINFYQRIVPEMAGSISVIPQEVADATNAQRLQKGTSALGGQHPEPQHQVLAASNQYIQPDVLTPAPHRHQQQYMASSNTQHSQHNPTQYTHTASPAFHHYNQVQQQYPLAASQYMQHATAPPKQTPVFEPDGLAEKLTTGMNDMLGNFRDGGVRNTHASDPSYSTLPQQRLLGQHLNQQQLPDRHPQQLVNEDIAMWSESQENSNQSMTEATRHDTMAYSMAPSAASTVAHNMNATMNDPMPEDDGHHTATVKDDITVDTYLYHATNEMFPPFYRSYKTAKVIEYRKYRNRLRRAWLLRPRTWRLRVRRNKRKHRKRRRLACLARLASALIQEERAGDTFAVTVLDSDMMPEVPSNAETSTYAEASAHSETYIYGEAPNHPENPIQVEAPTFVETPTLAEALIHLEAPPRFQGPAHDEPPFYLQEPAHSQTRTHDKLSASAVTFTPEAPPNVHSDPIPVEDSLLPGADDDLDPADLFDTLTMAIPRPPTPPRPRQTEASFTATNEPSASLTLFDSGSDDDVSPLPAIFMRPLDSSIENSESTLDQLLNGLQLQPTAPNPAMARAAATYNFDADPLLPESRSGSDDSLEQQPYNNPLDGHGSDFSENSQSNKYSNESVASGLTDQHHTDNNVNAPLLLLASRFSPPFQSPSPSRDPRLQDLSGENNNIVNPAHAVSDEIDDLVAFPQQVFADDETVSTPPFFPSPSRPLSPDIGHSKPVPPANIETQLPNFLIKDLYSSVSPPTGESSTQSSSYYTPSVPIRGVFDLRLHLPEDAYIRKRRYVEEDVMGDAKDKKNENAERQVELGNSEQKLKTVESEDNRSKRQKKKDVQE
ncbi:uncharacterized protein ATC70_005489 [Mucor velutinosus]|uniref:Uncharacterized protein n=1 Tax=Mucor velutinosus TaxID=708070 RepID=A0AAN7HYI5_9FUNG|nr:hypothetical protein ATC70_005489 [Mucor velutinosus]